MPKIREYDEDDDDIEDIEFPFHERPMTLEEADEFIKRYCSVEPSRKSIEEPDEILRKMHEQHDYSPTSDTARTKHHIESINHCPEGQHIHIRGSPREIQIQIPQIRGKEIQSPDDLDSNISAEFSGIKERDDYDSILKDAKIHMALMSELDQRTTITLKELKQIALRLDIPHHKASNWTFKGCIPIIYTVIDRATSKSEAMETISKLEVQLKGIRNWDDVENRLEEKYPNKGYEKITDYAEKKRHAKQFFEFIKKLENGGTFVGIASRVGMEEPNNKVSYIMCGRFPLLVSVAIKLAEKESFRPLLYKIQFQTPTVRGIEVRSTKQLEDMVNKRFSVISEREDYPSHIDSVRKYFELYEKYHDAEYISPEVFTKIQETYNLSISTAKSWLCKSGVPRFFSMLERALDDDEAKDTVSTLYEKLNGVTSIEKMDGRLGDYYLHDELQSTRTYKKQRKFAEEFFEYVESLSNGGLISDFVSDTGLSNGRVASYHKQLKISSLVNLVSYIPSESPEDGKKWLPLVMKSGGIGLPEHFIQVTDTISSQQDILDVLKQLKPIRTDDSEKHEKEFGEMNQHIALMYSLGVFVSDGCFSRVRYSSSSVDLKASKKYYWNTDFGEGFCYALARVGISAEYKGDGETRQKNGTVVKFNKWGSTSSPLLVWMRRTLLGLTHEEKMKEIPIRAEWILQMPDLWKIAFLQGVADGDGHATLKAPETGITSKLNHGLISRVLDSLGIKSSNYDECHILVYQTASIIRANEIGLFRYATGRKELLREIVEFLDASSIRTPISDNEFRIIQELHYQGLSSGKISEILWYEYKIARRSGSIRGIIRRMKQEESSSD